MQPQLSKLKQFLARSDFLRFFKLLIKRFIEDQGPLQASSLTYTTLLSIVPLMTVSLAILAAFPISDVISDVIQSFIFENFIPSSGDLLNRYFQQFSTRASQLGGVGFAFLIVVALMLMSNIDSALNRIWRTSSKRGILSRFLEYWTVLTLGPILIGGSVAATSYLVSIPILSDAVGTLNQQHILLSLTPIATSAIGFSLIYSIIPNRVVPIHHAIAGGIFAALLFEFAKKGFGLYLTHFPTYQAIYGALAVVPVFLVWIYLSWMVTLLGAEFSCCLGIFRDQDSELTESASQGDLLLALRLTQALWKAQHEGECLSPRQLSMRLGRVSVERIEKLLNQLKKSKLVLQSDKRTWALARNLGELTLYEFYHMQPFLLPEPAKIQSMNAESEQPLKDVLTHIEDSLSNTMKQSLEAIFSSPPRITSKHHK